MFLGMPLPSWKQILNPSKKYYKESCYERDEVCLFAESCMSLNIVFRSIKEVKGLERVAVWIPDYFCNQTVRSFEEEWIDLHYYRITEELEPDWENVKEDAKTKKMDAFIFTHYFGKYHSSIKQANDFCREKESILIEDCAHILFATGKVGQSGDFVIYSPHKQLPIVDGAVLKINRNRENKAICDKVKDNYLKLPVQRGDSVWFVKKAIQKIIPVHRAFKYYSGVHIGKNEKGYHEPKKISKEGYTAMCNYSVEDFKNIACIRRDNLSALNAGLKGLYPELVPYMNESVDVPYYAVYSLKNYGDKKRIVNELMDRGFTVLYWPDLPYEIASIQNHSEAFRLSEDIVIMPIHQGISSDKIRRRFKDRINDNEY